MIKNCTKCGTPTEFGVSHNSRQGYWCKPCRSKASAEEDLKKMLEANPSGCYAVCPVVV